MIRKVKLIGRSIAIISLLFLGCVIGVLLEQNHQKNLEGKKESISTIAVVNMDNGVMAGEQKINYASQLMNFPNERFVVTGLSDAKAGIENGIYAAYIVIPETFSEYATSIENDPQKVVMGYQYNVKLNENAQIQAMNDINDFINMMNSNMAYMYVDAILEEFHRIQDDSDTILQNDMLELAKLQNVNATQLIAVAEPIQEEKVDLDIQPVEFTAYTTQNDLLLDSMLSNYLEACQKGKDEFALIRETNVEVEASYENFTSTYDAVIGNTVDAQASLLETGKENLKDAVGLYNENVDAKAPEVNGLVLSVIEAQRQADQESANRQLEQILPDMMNKAYMQGYNDALNSNAGASEAEPIEEPNAMEAPSEGTAVMSIGGTITLSRIDQGTVESKTNAITQLFKLQAESEAVENVIQTDFVDALFDEGKVQIEGLSEVKNTLSDDLKDYESSLINFDPMQYIEDANLKTYLNEIESNTGNLMSAVGENNAEYVSYSAQVSWTTAENMMQLRNSLDAAHTLTSTNVENCVNDLISSRELINSQNVDMLEDFTDSLRYTRVDRQENTEVYDYIINPVVFRNTGQTVAAKVQQDSTDNNIAPIVLIILLCAGIVICGIEIVLGLLKQDREQQTEDAVTN